MQAAIGGQVDGLAATASSSIVGQTTSGALTCIDVAAATRYAPLPNCPTLAESGFPGFEGSPWVGFWVPKGTPAQIVAVLNRTINSIADDLKAAGMLKQNGELLGLLVQAADQFIRREVATWGSRVQAEHPDRMRIIPDRTAAAHRNGALCITQDRVCLPCSSNGHKNAIRFGLNPITCFALGATG